MLKKRFFKIVACLFIFIGLAMLLNSFQTITGFAIFDGASVNFGWYSGLWFLASGIILLLAEGSATGNLERRVSVYDSSKGKNRDHDQFYALVDPYLNFGKSNITLGEFKREVSRISKDTELMTVVRDEYGPQLQQIVSDEPERAEVARAFLNVLGIEEKREEESYELSRKEKEEIKAAFHGGFKIDRVTSRQRNIFRKYKLETEIQGTGHLEVRYPGYAKGINISATPSDLRAGKNLAASVINLIEEGMENTDKD